MSENQKKLTIKLKYPGFVHCNTVVDLLLYSFYSKKKELNMENIPFFNCKHKKLLLALI